MGEGLVLEQGTHAELLGYENGAYSRLVHAQKLRESKDEHDSDSDTNVAVGAEVDMKRAVENEVPLGRKDTNHSIASDLIQERSQRRKQNEVKEDDYTLFYLFARIGALNREGLWRYAVGAIFAIATGMIYPVFGIVYGQAIGGFSQTDPSVRSKDGDRNALWFFIIAIVSSICIGIQNYYFSSSAVMLTSKLRALSFRAILRQDIEFFDRDENSTGTLTANLSENPQKINGLAGVTLGTIVQSTSTLIGGSAIGLAYAYKPALVGMACIPFLMSTGYIRLVRSRTLTNSVTF
ncbi:hypothetical protein BDN67DRAFT_1017833 [Paxillus ammoniavirescens]|nr:hypothetical protein BDN67DRAFT_1017833 [Paxillus ammoniavirescens]